MKVISHYIRLPVLLSIILIVSWQLLLVSCSAKSIQPPYCTAYHNGIGVACSIGMIVLVVLRQVAIMFELYLRAL